MPQFHLELKAKHSLVLGFLISKLFNLGVISAFFIRAAADAAPKVWDYLKIFPQMEITRPT